jgi:predicted nucleic acid-binding protein
VRRIVVDTGPLVALLNARDEHHDWTRATLDEIEPPLLTCEAVLAEATYLVRKLSGGPQAILELIDRGVVQVPFRVDAEVPAVRALLTKYASVPMSLADACLVRMVELNPDAVVLTLDSDFRMYRRSGRLVVPVLMPG